MTSDDYARAIIAEGQRRGITVRGIVIALATGLVESNIQVYANAKVPASMALPHDAVGSDGFSVGIFQQQVVDSGNGWWWGDAATCMDPTLSAGLFYGRLARLDYNGPNSPGSYAQAVQQSAFPDRYDQRMTEAQQLYDRLAAQPGGQPVTVSGDPTWLEDVLRPVLGDRLRTLPGWQTDGVGGTMREIWGVIWHHTGNAAADAESISKGRPDLAGPLAQLHIAQDGIVTIVAVGPCNHAGMGSWAGLPTDDANDRTIGVECAWPRDTSITEATQTREEWPQAQVQSMVDVGIALARKIGNGADHNISHSEWARFGPAGWRQGKWDPGNFNMGWFRDHVRAGLAAGDAPPAPPAPRPVPAPVPAGPGVDVDREIWDQLRDEWPQLGGQTLVNALGEVRDKVLGKTDYANWKAAQ